MLELSERKWPVPVLAAARESLLASSGLRQGERWETMPAATAVLTKCKERTEKSQQRQGNPFALLPRF